MLTTLTAVLTPEQFAAWGWRIPFLVSVVLIGVGHLIRRTVDESPVSRRSVPAGAGRRRRCGSWSPVIRRPSCSAR